MTVVEVDRKVADVSDPFETNVREDQTGSRQRVDPFRPGSITEKDWERRTYNMLTELASNSTAIPSPPSSRL